MGEVEEISEIRLDLVKKLKPIVHEDLLKFCSSLNAEAYPEATIILDGKTKTIAPFLKIYEKLCENKKEKRAKSRLKNAEKIINSLAAVHDLVRERAQPRVVQERTVAKRFEGATKGLPPIEEMRGRKTAAPGLNEREKIEKKIERSEPLTREEVIRFVEIGYERHAKRIKDVNPIPDEKAKIKIVMCSDARQPIGTIVHEGGITIKQIAGNSIENARDREEIVIIIGHGGYESGCGAVKTATKLHNKGTKSDDESIESITTSAIPREITGSNNPELANAIYQAKLAERNGSRAFAIYFDMETKTVVQVYGGKNEMVDRIIDSVHLALAGSGNLAQQTAGFAMVTREGRKYPGKTIVDARVNTVFETYFYIDRNGEPKLTNKAIGSLRFAMGDIQGIRDNKIVVVTDPDPRIARKVAKLIESDVPGAIAIPMEEDWKTKQIKELK
ncbi:TPA: hypothetical protein HA238_01925 [Candidatus Micrarchaeota archaeon]|nr:hypothetical protein [Candidatus Micrarchaeota archaeon]